MDRLLRALRSLGSRGAAENAAEVLHRRRQAADAVDHAARAVEARAAAWAVGAGSRDRAA
jgi:hypothetical protein